MSIEKAVKDALAPSGRCETFNHQIEACRQFSSRMEEAGVVLRKQSFSIPLMERIVYRSES